MNYTSIEQSMELLKLGLSPESSDMYYLRIVGETYNQDTDMVLPMTDTNSKIQLGSLTTAEYPTDDMLPAWSLGALLELIPNYGLHSIAGKCSCVFYSAPRISPHPQYISDKYNDIFEAAYKMVVWLLENNYIKKESNH